MLGFDLHQQCTKNGPIWYVLFWLAELLSCTDQIVSEVWSPSQFTVSCEVQGQEAQVDQMLPDVLLFPAGSDLHDHPLVTNGSLVLQVRPPTMQ